MKSLFQLVASSFLLLTFFSTALCTSICGRSPYKDLLFLSSYSPAAEFCSKAYPTPPVTATAVTRITQTSHVPTTSTVSQTSVATATSIITSTITVASNGTALNRRLIKKWPAAVVTPAKSPPKSSCTGSCATWTSCQSKGQNFISTFCSCINTPRTATVTSTSTTVTTVSDLSVVTSVTSTTTTTATTTLVAVTLS